MAAPRPKGNAIPAAPTLSATFQLLTKKRRSTSRPTRKRKSTKPRFATRDKLGMDAAGNIAAVNPGILPITDGPSRIPPMTSAMTRGWRILESG